MPLDRMTPVLDWREVQALIELIEDIEGGIGEDEERALQKLKLIREYQQQRRALKKADEEKQRQHYDERNTNQK